jgi:hypothetical protein
MDIALVKFAANGVPHLRLGSVNELTEGQRVIVKRQSGRDMGMERF